MASWAAIYGLLVTASGAAPEAQPQMHTQDTTTARTAPVVQWQSATLALPTSEAEERLRLAHPTRFSAFHSAARLTAPSPATPTNARVRISIIAPELRTVSNSGLPFSLNEGTLWAGRGRSTLVTAGVALEAGPLTLQLAPQYTTSENRRFQVIPFPQFTTTPARSIWANPFHPPASSIDLPYRPGNLPIRRTVAGQSRVAVALPYVTAGVSTEHRWWGPTLRHPLALGASSEGFPHAFVETRTGIATPVGRLSGQWLAGTLSESAVFDDDPGNNHRALNGLLLALTPRADTALTLGIMRLVMSNARRPADALTRPFDFLRSVGQPVLATAGGTGRDQLTALFAHYAFPAAGFESWVEWARFAEPVSLADLLEYPGYSQGYTFGLQWSRPLRAGTRHSGTLRLAAEATNTEPDASIRVRPVATSYTSRTVPQGFTHRGRMLANPLGPGASGQWFAADVFASRLRVGAFAGRIRWDNATLWEPIVPQLKLEDITLLGGLRASLRVGTDRLASRVSVEYTSAVRLSYLYQSKLLDWASGTNGGVDLPNRTLAVSWSTIAFR